jgi:hypothetical protein
MQNGGQSLLEYERIRPSRHWLRPSLFIAAAMMLHYAVSVGLWLFFWKGTPRSAGPRLSVSAIMQLALESLPAFGLLAVSVLTFRFALCRRRGAT